MKTAVDIGLRQYCSISIRYGLAYCICSLFFLVVLASMWLKSNDIEFLFPKNQFFDPNIVRFCLVFPTIAVGYFLFVGIREIVASPRRYRQLTWRLQNISPTNVSIKIQIHPFSRGCTYYVVDLYSVRATFNSRSFARLNIMAPTWNVSPVLNRLISAKAYFDPKPHSGVLLRVKDKFLVYLPHSIETFTLFRS
jgi:hypothetical protein